MKSRLQRRKKNQLVIALRPTPHPSREEGCQPKTSQRLLKYQSIIPRGATGPKQMVCIFMSSWRHSHSLRCRSKRSRTPKKTPLLYKKKKQQAAEQTPSPPPEPCVEFPWPLYRPSMCHQTSILPRRHSPLPGGQSPHRGGHQRGGRTIDSCHMFFKPHHQNLFGL